MRVLNVNDRDIPRYVAAEMLRREGFDVVSASSGAEALALATDNIDVAVLDVQLPDVNGFELCKQLKSEPATRNIIVLLTSATFVNATSKVTGLDAGADAYLVQPYEAAEFHATLRSLLRARAAERRASALAAELRLAMQGRDEFLAMLGHELRNPLGAITTAVELLLHKGDPAATQRLGAMIQRQTRSLVRIVDDLLDVARLTRGKLELDRKLIRMCDVVERVIETHAESAVRAGHTVVFERPPRPVVVSGDAVRLDQVVSNLLANSIKYTPRGGRIEIRLSTDPGVARLEVIDNGIGMDATTAAHVFEVFVQAKQSLDRARGGLGLGLAVVQQLVRLHGGTVVVHSDGEGKGSRFIVELPLATADDHRATPVDGVAARPLEASRIVLIEDNDDVRDTMADVLTQLGHRVDTAADGLDGVELVRRVAPDVVLVDIGLPGLDGYEVARRLRAEGNGATPRLVAITGYGQPEDQARALNAGFDEHLVKPVTLEALQGVLAAPVSSSSSSEGRSGSPPDRE